MKKLDYIVIGSIMGILIITVILMNVFSREEAYAIVYYDGVNILEIDLSIEDEYVVEGEIGEVVLEVKNGLIHVLEVNCPDETCKEIGWTNNPARPIICVPNKIYVAFVGASEVDVLLG